MNSLYQHSLKIILENQKETGAIIASPNFSIYQYSWFRDGTYSAHALLVAGFAEQAGLFHSWAADVVLRFEDKMKHCINVVKSGGQLIDSACLHSRFTIEGLEVPGNWGHHQLDGLGIWLWALVEYLRTIEVSEQHQSLMKAAELAGEYLAALWKYPCSDCWEENETLIHTYSLAAIYAGLKNYGDYTIDNTLLHESELVKQFILESCTKDGAFVKSIGLDEVDANLMGLFVPCEVTVWQDEKWQTTVKKINNDLATPIGLHRYPSDTYYGGGEWVLLTAWMGWAYAKAGEPDKAQGIADWIELQQDKVGNLPEQIPHELINKADYLEWVNRWGDIANPLVWSHSMYVILIKAIEDSREERLDGNTTK